MSRLSVQALATLTAAFPRQKLDDGSLKLYAAQMGRFDDADALMQAIQKCIDHEEFFPTIATIRGYYKAAVPLSQPALEQPSLTKKQIDENVRRVKTLVAAVGLKPVDEEAA